MSTLKLMGETFRTQKEENAGRASFYSKKVEEIGLSELGRVESGGGDVTAKKTNGRRTRRSERLRMQKGGGVHGPAGFKKTDEEEKSGTMSR